MISVNWEKLLGEFGDLAKSYQDLPSHIAKKHLLASMRRSIQKARGPQLLRANTPPIGLKRGRKAKNATRRGSTGELRRSVITKAKWIGTNKAGFAVAGIGYRYGWNSRKAIWAEYGTRWQKAVGMMQRTFDQIRQPVAASLSAELAKALDKAVAEKNSTKNKGYGG